MIFLKACSSDIWYESAQRDRKIKCERQFEGQARTDCLGDFDMSFEEYQEQRQALLKEADPTHP